MNDAAAIISTCSRLLSNLQTLTETEARAAAAKCQAWLAENHHPQPQQALALMPRPASSRLPPEILNAMFRHMSRVCEKTALLACSSLKKEWRRHGWPYAWRTFDANKEADTLASIACRFSLPWALEATSGIQVRCLKVGPPLREPADDLALLLSIRMFSGLRLLSLRGQVYINPLHLLVVFRSLPNLISLECECLDDPVAWGRHLKLGAKEESNVWRTGFGRLKALDLNIDQQGADGFMLEKLAMGLGLGAKLESLHLTLCDPGTKSEKQLPQVFRNLSRNCPYLVDLDLSLPPFLDVPHLP